MCRPQRSCGGGGAGANAVERLLYVLRRGGGAGVGLMAGGGCTETAEARTDGGRAAAGISFSPAPCQAASAGLLRPPDISERLVHINAVNAAKPHVCRPTVRMRLARLTASDISEASQLLGFICPCSQCGPRGRWRSRRRCCRSADPEQAGFAAKPARTGGVTRSPFRWLLALGHLNVPASRISVPFASRLSSPKSA